MVTQILQDASATERHSPKLLQANRMVLIWPPRYWCCMSWCTLEQSFCTERLLLGLFVAWACRSSGKQEHKAEGRNKSSWQTMWCDLANRNCNPGPLNRTCAHFPIFSICDMKNAICLLLFCDFGYFAFIYLFIYGTLKEQKARNSKLFFVGNQNRLQW